MSQTMNVSQELLTVYAPASMGNVGVGFDLLGAALAPIDGSLLGDRVMISKAKSGIDFSQIGQWAHKLPSQGKDNIVYQCAEFFLQKLQREDGVTICLEKNLPVGSGLGSSASSVVAALYALNEHFDQPFDEQNVQKVPSECVIVSNALNKYIHGQFENASIDSDRPNSFMEHISELE